MKKNKLTINKLALGNLKHRKKQYLIMIIGIVLAMTFSSSILFLFSSAMSSVNEMQAQSFGRQKMIAFDVDKKVIDDGKQAKLIGDNGYAHIIGYGFADENSEFDGTAIAWLDDEAKKLANPVLVEGAYPKKEDEIAIESLALIKMNISAGVGDTITLKVKNQNGGETFEDYTEKTYKLTGILKNKRSNLKAMDAGEKSFIPAAFVADNTKPDLGGKEALCSYFNLYDDTQKTSLAFDEYRMANLQQNKTIWLTGREIINRGDQNGWDLVESAIFAALIIAVLMLISCIGIINAFSTNLKERKKQIGMLRAVGTTKKQIIHIFGREAFFISLIAVPFSILISYFAVSGIVKLLGDDFIFVPTLWVLPLCAVLNVAVVMAAAMIPLISASKITPMQAIRNIDSTRKMRKLKIRTKKEFNVSSLIAKRSMIFGRGRQIAVSIILIIAIVGSGYAVSWWTYGKDNFYHNQEDYKLYLSNFSEYNGVNYSSNNVGFSESQKQEMLSSPYIESGVGQKQAEVNLLTPYTTSDYRKELSDNYVGTFWDNANSQDEAVEAQRKVNQDNYDEILYTKPNNYSGIKELQEKFGYGELMAKKLYSIDENVIEEAEKYVFDGKIDIKKLNAGEEIILIAPQKIGVYFKEAEYKHDTGGLYTAVNEKVSEQNCIFTDECDFHAGDKLTLSMLTASQPDENEDGNTSVSDDTTRQDKEVTIGAIIKDVPEGWGLSYYDALGILTTTSGMNHFVENQKYRELSFYLNQDCTAEIDSEIIDIISSITDSVEASDYISEYGYQEMQKSDTSKAFTAMMTMLILLLVICLSMINNSITANIRENKTKIGTLRAVGAAESDLVKSYIKQLLSMLLWGCGIGFASFFISFFINWLLHNRSTDNIEMICNPLGSIIFCIIVFAVCSLNLWSKIRSEMKNSIVENIREL